ncbi:CheR family methyltransferase [Magnetospirillum sulfuroxidans]|uniref:Chemotaxis protein methyltransferase n=1 Tax=Magnetospirillum sulfuroxidans TaxID=611300 RepID=A0ABS5IFG0_9PROT|nr:CheR family methyltransferase [Magnetospirillum sulfuroxidans]MBR9972468.1 chemotaxis protein CheR [Magnetospirillum sulfuroxidans]
MPDATHNRRFQPGPPIGDHFSPRQYRRLADLIEAYCGIKVGEKKQTMVEGRLRSRVRDLGLRKFDDYSTFLFDEGGLEQELSILIDAITTNKTDFFREPGHFEILAKRIVPELVKSQGIGASRPCRVWSSACSTGPEPYTLAMVLSDVALENSGFKFQIFASDICTDALQEAVRAVYTEDFIAPVPMLTRKRYLLKSRDKGAGLVRMAPEIRRAVTFTKMNLLERKYPFKFAMDVIFCRNIIIYFDRAVQQRVIGFLCDHLVSGGYLIMGHSEALNGLDLPLELCEPTVYRRI